MNNLGFHTSNESGYLIGNWPIPIVDKVDFKDTGIYHNKITIIK